MFDEFVGFPSHQDQYVFIHDALLEAIECGVTEVAARDISMRFKMLINPESSGTTLSDEFQRVSSTIHYESSKTFSMLPANQAKNRYNDVSLLPCEAHYTN